MDYRLSDTEFYLKDAGDISYLYMPLVNEKIMSCITPDGHGDSKISQNHFLLEPVSVENLHSSMSSRNFWCVMEKDRVWSVLAKNREKRRRDRTYGICTFFLSGRKRSGRNYAGDAGKQGR